MINFPGIDKEKLYKLYPEDPILLVTFAISFFLVRKLLIKILFKPLADFVNVPKVPEKKGHTSTRYQKFIENAWYSLYYPLSAGLMLYVLWDKGWIFNPYVAVNDQPHFEVFKDLDYLYLLQLGYYIQLLINLVFIDEKLDDFYEMLSHHFLTLVLVFFSYLTLWHRIGTLVFFLHDISDICLYLGKACHNASWEKAASIIFPLFIISFFFTRLVYFPWLIYHTYHSNFQYEKPSYFFDPNRILECTQNGLCLNGHCLIPHRMLTYALMCLFCLHCYWFYRIILLVKSTIRNKGIVPGDPRYKEKNQ